MNERFKELTKQAGLEMCSCGCDMPTRQTVEFAALIIRECIDVCEQTHDTSNGKMRCANDDESIRIIKERFGIEL